MIAGPKSTSRRPIFWLPFRAAAVAVAIIALPLLLFQLYLAWSLSRWLTWRDLRWLEHALDGHIALYWIFLTGIYAFIRTIRFHPAASLKYSAWLSSTPWRADRPLPLGPANLVWEDLVPAIVVAAMSTRPLLALNTFAIIYGLYVLRIGFDARDRKWFSAYFISMLAGEILIWPSPWIIAALDLLLIGYGDWIVRRTLRDLPWNRPVAAEKNAHEVKNRESKWPLAPLSPPKPLRASSGWLIAVVTGWVAFCISTRAIEEDPRQAASVALATASPLFFAALIRWVIYTGQYFPPISTWGRIRTGRLIIPEYDYVLIAPLAAAAIAVFAPIGSWFAGRYQPMTIGATVVAVFAIILNAGPTRAHWQLTGAHRIVKSIDRSARRRSA